jgi:hypothetical protein
LFSGASISQKISKKEYLFIFHISSKFNNTDEEIIENIKEALKNKSINQFLYHEIKHLLDYIDESFKHDIYFDGPDPEMYDPDDKNQRKQVIKYMSQDKEIAAQLISVLGDLEKIKHNFPEITMKDAFEKSKSYSILMKYIIPEKKKKYQQKIIHFWNSHQKKGNN